MLAIVSDLHLGDDRSGRTPPLQSMLDQLFERARRAQVHSIDPEGPLDLLLLGDVVELVRTRRWRGTGHTPYESPSPGQSECVERIVHETLDAHAALALAVRRRVEAGQLRVHYVLGNHDRLLGQSAGARAAIREALTGRTDDAPFALELALPEYGVLAYHGHRVEPYCHEEDGGAPISDAVGYELITRFPERLRAELGDAVRDAPLEDIDDVRPLYAVPAWIRALAGAEPGWGKAVSKSWRELVREFLENPFVRDWMRRHHKALTLDYAGQLRLALKLSAGVGIGRSVNQRLVKAHDMLAHFIDARFVRAAARALEASKDGRLRFVVNGHTHFATLAPLGTIGGGSACYFNSGTWRRLHRLGGLVGGGPAFISHETMTFLLFYPKPDGAGRRWEQWTGALGETA